jgi:CDP-paratose 2-epimerase
VYGPLPDLALERDTDRWLPLDPLVRETGINESRPLDFCTPHGCSKGGADQYVLDWAKSYGVPAAVLRMSCIYGPHEHGNEDEGWIAHFLLQALAGEPLTIHGDGAQVRDVLHVDDLVRALLLVRDGIGKLAGEPFNVGGGAGNAISLLELVDLIEELHGSAPELRFAEERHGEQRWYVSDTTKLQRATGWAPAVDAADGIASLYSRLAPVEAATA